jgi:uncharacterized protein
MSVEGDRRFARFGLVLMTTHACTLRCTYCYTGAKTARHMTEAVAGQAIERAARSVRPGGRLELSFFGGEPLLVPELLLSCMEKARRCVAREGIELYLGVTTNGLQTSDAAWAVMMTDDLDLTVSFDGLPAIHDRHRSTASGQDTSTAVLATIQKLVAHERPFHVQIVVRPDTVDRLAEGIAFLRARGVRQIETSLDLWTAWSPDARRRLQAAVRAVGELWRQGLPEHGVSWLDEKLMRLAGVPVDESARCGFGFGQIAVAPSGRLYPCERLIADDRPDDPMRLPGTVDVGTSFLDIPEPCAIEGNAEAAACRCSNYIRTGDPARADSLLCLVDESCTREVARLTAGVPMEVSRG